MKIGVVGAGAVGSATAFALVMSGVASEVVLIDMNESKAEAEAKDISHAAPFSRGGKIRSGTYADLENAEIVIVTAGANQKPGETRIDLLGKNVKIFENIIPQIALVAPDTILIIAANPVDVMTKVALKLSGFSKERVIGSGTVLDTARFRTLLSDYLEVSAKSVHADVIGEHGDSEVLTWSSGEAGSLSLEEYAESIGKPLDYNEKEEITKDVVEAAYQIIAGKGATCYGIAGALTQICSSIISDSHAILTVSSVQENVEGVKEVCLSLPSVVTRKGVLHVIKPKLSTDEREKLRLSALKMKEYADNALEMIAK